MPIPESVPFGGVVEEPSKRGPWLAVAAIAGVAVAGGAYWFTQNPGILGGESSQIVETAEPGEPAVESPVSPSSTESAPLESVSPETSGGAEEPAPPAPEVAAAPPPKVEPAPKPPPAKPKAAPAAPRAAKTVEVTFSTTQAGARVTVDGKPQWSCSLPCSLQLPRGKYTASVLLMGFYPVRKPFTVGSDPVDVPFEMDEVVGTVLVSSSPIDANIYVDGKKFDGLTNTSLRLKPGYHVIKVEKDGAGMAEISVLVQEGQLSAQQFSLGAQPPRAKLNLTTTPAGARIVLNDKRLPGSTPRELDLPPGDYRVMLTLPGHRPVIKEINLPANQPVALDEELTPR